MKSRSVLSLVFAAAMSCAAVAASKTAEPFVPDWTAVSTASFTSTAFPAVRPRG